MAFRSSQVKVGKVPNPPWAPPAVVVPGKIINKLAPIDAKDCSTCAFAPSPIATIAITAETPMTTPSVVKNERSLLRKSAVADARRVSKNVIDLSLLRRAGPFHSQAPAVLHTGYPTGSAHL